MKQNKKKTIEKKCTMSNKIWKNSTMEKKRSQTLFWESEKKTENK